MKRRKLRPSIEKFIIISTIILALVLSGVNINTVSDFTFSMVGLVIFVINIYLLMNYSSGSYLYK